MPDEKVLNGKPTLLKKDLERFLPEGRSLGDLPTELVDELQGLQFTQGEIISERFEMIEQLGFGGMGAVYKVKDLLMRGQLKALKIMLPSLVRSSEARERFISEAEIAQSLRHEGVTTVYDIGRHRDVLFLTMELLEGQSLDRFLKSKGGKLGFLEAVDIMLKICEGLSYAHKKGVIHRDIKPQNIFVLPDGRVKLLDFGLAKLLSPGRLTRSSMGLGTAYYMSPEQSMGKEVDERSDIFSLGVVFYQMLIGRIPMGRFKLPSTLNPAIPSSIDSVVEKCLDEQPEERYLKVESLVADIEQVRSAYEKEEKERIEREQKALAERKRKIDSLLKKGKSGLDRNNFDEAINTFNEILGIDSEHKEARELLDRAKAEKARFEERQRREEEHRRTQELKRKEEERLRREAEEAERRKQDEEWKKKEEEERKQKIESLLNEGRDFLKNKKFNRAIEAFEKLIRLDYKNQEALELIERAKSEKKKLEDIVRKGEEERKKAEKIKRQEEEDRFRREEEKRREEDRKKLEAEEAKRKREEEDRKRKEKIKNFSIISAVFLVVIIIGYIGLRPKQVPPLSPGTEKPADAPVVPLAKPAPVTPKPEAKPVESPSTETKPAHPSPKLGERFSDPVTGMEFVWVPGGVFEMGDTWGDGENNEKPVHKVKVDGFWIGKFEVTQGQWQKVMDNNPSYFKSGDNYPVENVSWEDIQEFVRRLNQKTGKKYRLPSEAQWEYAARSGGKREKWAGTSSESELGEYAWYGKNLSGITHPVGQKRPNGLGLYDMSGNVLEWCQDWYDRDYYKNSPRENPEGPPVGQYRVLRGGRHEFDRVDVRASGRISFVAGNRYNFFGSRLVFLSK